MSQVLEGTLKVVVDKKSDPYVVLGINNNKVGYKKTRCVKNTLNPVFEFYVKNARADFLYGKVFDKDTLTKDDKLGTFKIPMSILQCNTSIDMEVKLRGVKSGSIKLQITPQGFGILTEQDPNINLQMNSLMLQLESADAKLKKTIQPYVVFKTTDGNVLKAPVVKPKTPNKPMWTEKNVFAIPLSKEVNDVIEIVLMDKDKLGKDDVIGTGYLPVAALPKMKCVKRSIPLWHKVRKNIKEKQHIIRGSVTILAKVVT